MVQPYSVAANYAAAVPAVRGLGARRGFRAPDSRPPRVAFGCGADTAGGRRGKVQEPHHEGCAGIGKAVGDDHDQTDKLFDEIIRLRDTVRAFNLPYLALPVKTPKEVALDVFIKMNTSSVHLSTYDIVVALVEEETGRSLHEHVDA